MKTINEIAEHEAVLDLLPETIAFIEQYSHKLSFICGSNRIKNLLNKLYNIVKLPIFNYELCLMTELADQGSPEKGKIYLEKINNKLRYLVQDLKNNKQEGWLDINIKETLTKQILNSKRSEILKITSERGHTNTIQHYRFSVVKINLILIKNIFEIHISNNHLVDRSLISLVKQQEHIIRIYYKWIKESIETLQDLNRRITKNLTKPVSNKIKGFLIQGANSITGKLVAEQFLSHMIAGSQVDQKTVVEDFYKLFIKNSLSILNGDEISEQQLSELQDTIIYKIKGIKDLSLHEYFAALIEYATLYPYSHVMLLLKYFSKNDSVIENIIDFSRLYKDLIVNFLKFITQLQDVNATTEEYREEHIKMLARLILLFPQDLFIETIITSFKQVKLFFIPMYEAWIEFLLEIKDDYSDINKLKLHRTLDNFKELFIYFHNLSPGMLYKQMQKAISLENAEVTNVILKKIFPKDVVVNLLSSLKSPIDIKCCFDHIFFEFLLQKSGTNSFNFKEQEFFLSLVLYVSNFDRNTTKATANLHQSLQELQSFKLTNKDLEVRLQQETQRAVVLDLFKITAEQGSRRLRINVAIRMLRNISNNRYQNLEQLKTEMLNAFIDNEDRSVIFKFYQQLSKTGYIHLLKNINGQDRQNLVLKELKRSNKAFRGYCAYLQRSGSGFDLSGLTPGFNVPFYLSFNEQLDLADLDYNLVMTLVFKIFTHATDDYNERPIDDYRLEFDEIINSAQRLLKFYDDLQKEFDIEDPNYHEIEKAYAKLKQDVIKFIIDGFSENNADLLAERKRNARLIIDNAINYKGSQQQICSINSVIYLELNKSTAETPSIIEQFFKEIQSIFQNTLARNGKTLSEWVDSTSSIGEKIAFLCARRKYSESDFKTWFFNKNLNKITAEQLEPQLNLVRQDLEHLDHKEALSKVGINYLQYNQEYSLALIYKHLADHNSLLNQQEHNNIFMKLGTGQGKSLVIAETAYKILNENSKIKQIFIITCYSHLATRDHKRFEPFFNSLGIKAICSVNLTEQQKSNINLLLEHKVIYTDLQSYFDLIRHERKKLLEDQPGLLFPDPKDCILIMDEFDSLILDADEIYQYLTNFSGVGSLRGTLKQKIKTFFGLNDPSTDPALQNKLFDDWYNNMLREKERNPDGYTKESSLGIVGIFAKAFLQRLEETGTAQFVHSFISPLLFYTQFKQVIGFSGSITAEAMFDLEKFFCSSTGQAKNSDYYCIPPFFGEEDGKNRVFTNGPDGKLCKTEVEFLDEIVKEVKAKRQQGQPILIFADLTSKQVIKQKTDFDLIKEKLQVFIAEEQLHIIKNEEDVVAKLHYIGKKDSVTLASRILARGADLKVDHYITQGLHLIVTYYPPRGTVYTQMLGRTARQDEQGSYAVITMKKENYAKGNPTIYPSERKNHELCTYFFERTRQGKKKWPLVFDILRETSMHEDLQQLKATIDRNFPVMQ